MRHSQDLNYGRKLPIHDSEREPLQQKPARAAGTSRRTLRRIGNRRNSTPDLARKSQSGPLAALKIMRTQLQTPGSLLHGIRLAYFPCVSRDEIRRWTSSHGTVLAFPESNSAMRRLISSFQALSAPSPTAASRLSIREQAKSARSSSERERAFCSRSRTCCVIRRL